MKKNIIFLVLFITVIIFITLYRKPQTSLTLQTIKVGTQELSVEYAKTNAQITKGLGERDTLGSDGMLFEMSARSTPTFWMKGMRFDLDFVWIDGNRVVDLTSNVPAEMGVPEYRLHVYSPKVPVTHVLEMNAGEVRKRGIEIGNTVVF